MEDVLQSVFATNVGEWLLGLTFGFGVAAILWLGRMALKRWLVAYTKSHNVASGFFDLSLQAVQHFYLWYIIAAGLFATIQHLPHMEAIDRPSQTVFTILSFFQAGLVASAVLREWANDYMVHYSTIDRARIGLVNSLVRVGYIVLWSVLLLLGLQNFGVDVTALVAGLGIGGVAVAFALQNVLQDIFASFSIVFDKPFVIGDFVITNDYMGSIERIGLKTTRIRSLSGEQIVISNNDLLGSRIRNYGRMKERRVVFGLGVEYGTSPEKLELIPMLIRKAIEAQDKTRFDRCNWINYGAYSLDFETVFFMTVPDNNQMIATREKIFLDIYQAFEREKIAFAFPTQVEIPRFEKLETAGVND